MSDAFSTTMTSDSKTGVGESPHEERPIALQRTGLLAFMRDQLGVDTDGVDDSTPLFSSGMIDSFSLVTLVAFLETASGSRIDLADLTIENLDSVAQILAFVGRLQR